MSTAERELTDTQIPLEEVNEFAAQAPLLYDSTARQRVPITLALGDEEVEAVLVLEPVTDPHLVRYVKKCEEVSAETDDDDPLSVRLSAAMAATEVLFDGLAADLEGIGEEGEEKPEDWKQIFSPQDKVALIEQIVFNPEYVEPKKARSKPRWGQEMGNLTTRVKFPFSGQTVPTSHTLKKVSAATYGEYSVLMSRVASNRGMDAHMLRLAQWYDEHHVAHEGYKGEVPRHHRAAVFVLHMTRQRASVRKN